MSSNHSPTIGQPFAKATLGSGELGAGSCLFRVRTHVPRTSLTPHIPRHQLLPLLGHLSNRTIIIMPLPTSTTTSNPSSSYNSLSSPTNPTDRVRHIASQMANPVLTTSFPADAVPQAPEDPLFGLARECRADNSPDKIDLVGRPFS